ncbi:FAD-dependent oxidoreductase, partial [Pseudacidovorax intermedius]
DPQPWAGLRPATPSGLPVVGRAGRAPANVLFNVGHGALGFTLAFGTARQVAHLLAADTALVSA